jgi:hypothetical protein
MMEAAGTSETSVNFYQTTRRNNPEDSHQRTVMLVLREGKWKVPRLNNLQWHDVRTEQAWQSVK